MMGHCVHREEKLKHWKVSGNPVANETSLCWKKISQYGSMESDCVLLTWGALDSFASIAFIHELTCSDYR